MFLDFRRTDRDVRQVVADPFEFPEQFDEDDAAFNRAFALVAAGDVFHFVLAREVVDFPLVFHDDFRDFGRGFAGVGHFVVGFVHRGLKRGNVFAGVIFFVFFGELVDPAFAGEGGFDEFAVGSSERLCDVFRLEIKQIPKLFQVGAGNIGELNAALRKTLCQLHDGLRVIGDALRIVGAVHEQRDQRGLRTRQVLAGDLDKIVRNVGLHGIDKFLVLLERFVGIGVVAGLEEVGVDGAVDHGPGVLHHAADFKNDLFERD